jgi:predicted GNAT family acetyltransferase
MAGKLPLDLVFGLGAWLAPADVNRRSEHARLEPPTGATVQGCSAYSGSKAAGRQPRGVPAMTNPDDEAQVTVRDAPDKKRYEILVEDQVAGFTVYRPRGEVYTFSHTEVDEAFAGRGLASVLIKFALDDMRARGIAVLPDCPFVRRYISRHSDYLDLVPANARAKYDLPLGS